MARARLVPWYRWIWDRLVKIDASPEQVAGGFAVGVFTGVAPTMGLGAPIAAGIAALMHWNLAASVAGNIIGVPPMLFGVWAASAALGAWMFGLSYDEAYAAYEAGTVMSLGWRYIWAYLAGNAIVTAILVPAAYWAVLGALRRHRAQRARKASRRRG